MAWILKLSPQPASPSTKPNQGLSLLEYPLIRYITESTPYSDKEVKAYVIQAIRLKEITYKTMNDEVEETPILFETVLKVCKENQLLSNKKKSQYKKVEERVLQVSKDPVVWAEAAEEGKKKGRLVSQSELTERDSLTKTVRTTSPITK